MVTLEGWSRIMRLYQDAFSFWVWPYFVALIVLGSWFTVNLSLVVIATQFKITKKRYRLHVKHFVSGKEHVSLGKTVTLFPNPKLQGQRHLTGLGWYLK